jgi:ligand-binding SRPBCC domain-containing protein
MNKNLATYSFWHHKHFFEATPTGTKMTDVVHYGLPLGILGRIMNTLVVKNKLKSIFEYRVTKVDELFNKSNEQASCFPFGSDAICVSRIT